MELLQRKVILGGIIGLFVLIIIFVVFLYIPNINKMSKIDTEVNGLRKQIAENEAMAKDLGKLRNQIAGLEESQREFMARIVPRAEILTVVRQLVQQGDPYHLTFTEVRPPGLDTVMQSDNADSPIKPVPFQMTIQGRYLDIAQYIESLDAFPYFLRTPEIEVIGREDIRPVVETKVLINLFASSLVASNQ
jgi:Tfp pilus assembly protein PilO